MRMHPSCDPSCFSVHPGKILRLVCVVSVCCCFFLPACVSMCEPERLTFFCNFTVDYTWLARERRAVC